MATKKSGKAARSGSTKTGDVGAIYQEAEKVLRNPTPRNAHEAAAILAEALERKPDDREAHWRIARGYITALEHETGTVLVERSEYYPVLSELGSKALAASEKAYTLDRSDPDALGWLLVSYGYHAVAIGVVRAVLGGAARRYLQLADEINVLDPAWHSGAGHRALGRFYREAPWPKRSVKKALDHFRKALELGPRRMENRLHLALALMDDRQNDEARDLLRQVIKGKPEASEKHFFDSLIVFAKGKLADLE